MLHSQQSRRHPLINLLRANLLYILALSSVFTVFVYPYIGLILVLSVIYLILSQFITLPLRPFFRSLGYDCYYFQYNHDILMNTKAGRIISKNKELYRYDYISMGYNSFDNFMMEITMMDRMWNETVADDILASCFD